MKLLATVLLLSLGVVASLFGASTGKKISDYTETLTVSDPWMYEIAVPGVTNYKVSFGTMATNIIARSSGGAGSLVTNANQFGTSTTLTLKSGMLVTNPTLYGSVTLPGVTALRPAFINGAGIITNVSGTPTGLLFVRDDGVLAVPGGGGDVTTSQLNSASNSVFVLETTRNGTVGTNGTNFGYLIGANGTSYVNAATVALTNALALNSSNNVRVAAGTGTTVTSAGSGGVQIFTVNSTAATTQMVAAAIGTLTLTNALSVDVLNVNLINLTNALGSNQVRHGYQDLTNIIRRQTFYADAGYMVPNTTEGATFITEETSSPTNRMFDSHLFSGVITNSVQFKYAMPLNWDLSTVKMKLWTSSTNNIGTTTNVWAISAAAIKHGSVITNINWGTELNITNAVSSGGGQAYLTPATPALTVGNSPAAAGNLVWFRIRRLPGHVGDNDGGVQKLLGAWVMFGETMSEVASW